MSYTYQWKRCDADGANCVDIGGATSATYTTVVGDDGHRIRVRVSDGVHTVTSDPTAVINAGGYVSERLGGSLDNPSFWFYSPATGGESDPLWPKHFSWIADGPGGARALRVTAPAATSPLHLADGTTVTSSSVTGQLVGLESHVTSAEIPFVHAGWDSGDPSTTSGVGKHEETWFRHKMRLPIGYRPTLGTQNSTWELHYDRGSEAALGTAVSAAILVEGVGGTSTTVGGVAYDTSPSNVNRLLLQFMGGGTTESGIGTRVELLGVGETVLGHWYDIVSHIVFDTDAGIGYWQVWVDGVKKVDTNRKTQYQRPDTSRGYQEDIGIYNYRHWANWSSSIDYQGLGWGPSSSSVGFTP